MLSTGLGGEHIDWQRAARVLQLAASQGDADACGYLAWITLHGFGGIDKNAATAASLCASRVSEWEERAKHGDATAQSILGWCHLNGTGVDKNEEEAVRLCVVPRPPCL
jgi:TPR repeat protein